MIIVVSNLFWLFVLFVLRTDETNTAPWSPFSFLSAFRSHIECASVHITDIQHTDSAHCHLHIRRTSLPHLMRTKVDRLAQGTKEPRFV